MPSTSVDLQEALRAALDEIEPLLGGRIVDIEMSRLRVLADPVLFRRELASLIESALVDAEPTHSLTVRVARRGTAVQIEVFSESGGGSAGVIGSMTVPLASGASNAADA